jgi:MarR family transcriptional regulator, organic hydroperoxide resistance regulator
LGLTYTQHITIIALWEEDNQTVSGLGEKLFLESNMLTPMLKRLEVMGYLERQRDPEDERQVRVRLTKYGRQLPEKALTMNLSEATGFAPDKFAKAQKAIVALRNDHIKSVQNSECALHGRIAAINEKARYAIPD